MGRITYKGGDNKRRNINEKSLIVLPNLSLKRWEKASCESRIR